MIKKINIVLLTIVFLATIGLSGCNDKKSKPSRSSKNDNSSSQVDESKPDTDDSTGVSDTPNDNPGDSDDKTDDDNNGNTDDNGYTGNTGNTGGNTGGSTGGTTGGTTKPSTPPSTVQKLSYVGYNLKWKDDFNGTTLNRADWNYETHEPGWVNNELQEYVDSTQNVYVENGNLVIKANKVVNGGNVSYTSGRVNTQGKHDFKYGIFEMRAKFPGGQGFLPAFWMMPTNESLYGQWPRCGEIDIAEILGHKTNTAYGTIHYGNPHRESQGVKTLSSGNFVDQYHTFSVEWLPGKINWYIDGILYHTENDWYSKTENQGEITYPAPFDQPFYMILNLAVGGNWPGNPDGTTNFDKAKFIVDNVKVYQKASYNENVTKPVKPVILRNPDATGNYINNGNFAYNESLTDETNWMFKTTLGGLASTEIKNNSIKVSTTNQGTADYSVQLMQANIPMEKGATYKISFDAYADAIRTIKTAITAPDFGFSRYFPDTTVNLTTTKQSYSYTFKMNNASDGNGRFEFNLGSSGSTAPVYISNVKIIKTIAADPNEVEAKTILANGNHVYNGEFQEGTNRLAFWEVKNNCGANVSVTNTDNIRKLKVNIANVVANNSLIIGQSDLALSPNKKYALSFDASNSNAKEITVMVAGTAHTAQLTAYNKSYTIKFTTPESLTNTDIEFYMGLKGITYLDNVRLVEDTMIKNGDFSAGFAGYDIYADSSADASYIVDSLTENNAADFTINNTGDQDWKIQLKQNNVGLENGKWYKLKFKAKSSSNRKIRVIMQGGESKGWAVYSSDNIVDLTSEYQSFEFVFKMSAATDPEAFLSVCLGKIDVQITKQHRVCLDDFSLEEVEAPPITSPDTGINVIKNYDFSNADTDWTAAITSPGEAAVSFESNTAIFNVTNVGTADWNIQLKQDGIVLEKDKEYTAHFKVTSTDARIIKLAFLSTAYAYYGGSDISLEAGVEKEVIVTFTMPNDTDDNTTLCVSMGKIEGVNTPISSITLSDFSLVKNN